MKYRKDDPPTDHGFEKKNRPIDGRDNGRTHENRRRLVNEHVTRKTAPIPLDFLPSSSPMSAAWSLLNFDLVDGERRHDREAILSHSDTTIPRRYRKKIRKGSSKDALNVGSILSSLRCEAVQSVMLNTSPPGVRATNKGNIAREKHKPERPKSLLACEQGTSRPSRRAPDLIPTREQPNSKGRTATKDGVPSWQQVRKQETPSVPSDPRETPRPRRRTVTEENLPRRQVQEHEKATPTAPSEEARKAKAEYARREQMKILSEREKAGINGNDAARRLLPFEKSFSCDEEIIKSKSSNYEPELKLLYPNDNLDSKRSPSPARALLAKDRMTSKQRNSDRALARTLSDSSASFMSSEIEGKSQQSPWRSYFRKSFSRDEQSPCHSPLRNDQPNEFEFKPIIMEDDVEIVRELRTSTSWTSRNAPTSNSGMEPKNQRRGLHPLRMLMSMKSFSSDAPSDEHTSNSPNNSHQHDMASKQEHADIQIPLRERSLTPKLQLVDNVPDSTPNGEENRIVVHQDLYNISRQVDRRGVTFTTGPTSNTRIETDMESLDTKTTQLFPQETKSPGQLGPLMDSFILVHNLLTHMNDDDIPEAWRDIPEVWRFDSDDDESTLNSEFTDFVGEEYGCCLPF